MRNSLRQALGCFLAFSAIISSCGKSHVSEEAESPRSKVEAAFFRAATDNGIPMRMMMAAGYVESGLRGNQSSALYLSKDGSPSTTLSLPYAESAFGISLTDLGLTGTSNLDIESQIAAYGKFLGARVKDAGLPSAAITADEKMRWIWRLAEIHRPSAQQKQNLWVIFAREMITSLNSGFNVRDTKTGELIRLDPEANQLKADQLPDHVQKDLQLQVFLSEIRDGFMFSLLPNRTRGDGSNHPKKVEVIHCPFSLSACIDLQVRPQGGSARFGAHYVIPQDKLTAPGILQITQHNQSVVLTDSQGQQETVTDRIVIMLIGNSGRYVQGNRTYANPTWITDAQLHMLGVAVAQVCETLARTDAVNPTECTQTDSPKGLSLRSSPGAVYRWGDIADYDSTIFLPYISASEPGIGNVGIKVKGQLSLEAGRDFDATVEFPNTAHRVDFERLVRMPAPDNRLLWENVESKPVRDSVSKTISMAWFDAGPNNNGEQFFRAKVRGQAGQLLGWASLQGRLQNYSVYDSSNVSNGTSNSPSKNR